MQNSACLTTKNIVLLRAAHYSQIPRLAKPGHGRSLPCHRTWRHQTGTPLRWAHVARSRAFGDANGITAKTRRLFLACRLEFRR